MLRCGVLWFYHEYFVVRTRIIYIKLKIFNDCNLTSLAVPAIFVISTSVALVVEMVDNFNSLVT